MAKGDAAALAILRRIHESEVVLELHFPPARVAAVVAGPAPRPVSPLTGPRIVPLLTDPEAAPEREPLIVPCLWLDSPMSEERGRSFEAVARGVGGWLDGAAALARVAVADVLIDQAAPEKGYWFDRALFMVNAGLRYRLLKTSAMGPGFRAPHTVSVWLSGAGKE